MKKISFKNSELSHLLNHGRVEYMNWEKGVTETLNCLTNDSIIIEGYIFQEINGEPFKITVTGNSSPIKINNCEFHRLEFQGRGLGHIIFEDVRIRESLSLELYCKSFKLLNCTNIPMIYFIGEVSEDFILDNLKVEKLQINGVFSSRSVIQNLVCPDELRLSAIFQKDLIVEHVDVENFVLADVAVRGTFAIDKDAKFKEITFEKASIAKDFSICNSSISKINLDQVNLQAKLFIKSSLIDEIILPFTLEDPKKIYIREKTELEKVIITGVIGEPSTLDIFECVITELQFKNLHNSGTLRISDIQMKDNSILSICDCNLGKAKIFNCNFSNSKFEFDKSQISELFLSETDFPSVVFKGDKIDYGEGKLVYGQLQTVFQKQGDTVRSYEYLAREVKSYFDKLSWKHFFTKLNLSMNYISNNFGRNWFQGVAFSFAVGYFLFCCLLLTTKEFSLSFPTIKWEYTGSFFKFMNPLRHFETENLFPNNLTLTNWSYVVDFGARIFIAYGYYQTIQAFRKFGRH